MQHVSPQEFAPLDRIFNLSGEEYFDLLHPEGTHGQPKVLVKFRDNTYKSFSLNRDQCRLQMHAYLDESCFLTLNRFKDGSKAGSNLVALNALYLDLDYFDTSRWRGKSADEVQVAFTAHLSQAGLPYPSIFTQTGRGLAAIWLITEIPKKVLSRWQAAMKALVGLCTPFGVDKRAKDTSRLFRIPGSVNEKVNRTVKVSGGTGARYSFDTLADQIFVACDRPKRADLNAKTKLNGSKLKGKTNEKMPAGLTQAQRFSVILDDLEKYRNASGGVINEGYRNKWLHFYATCLTHFKDTSTIGQDIAKIAEIATPGLSIGEVNAIIKQAEEKAKLPYSDKVTPDGRYYYKGETIAEALGISSETARSLGLKQVVPQEEKRRRLATAERQRRQQNGAVTRAEYLANNDTSRSQPWLQYGLKRSQYYVRRKAGTLQDLIDD
jgi:hypothetical protein